MRILRMDDIGAASKKNEIHSAWRLHIAGWPVVSGNWLFLKYISPFKAWGPYRELEARDFKVIFRLLERRNARLTAGVTACWVEDDGSLTPYPKKFPEAAAYLKSAAKEGLVEIANHGLTHCILADTLFRPRRFRGNREYHREFNAMLPLSGHLEHVRRAQEILQEWSGEEVTTLIPPGNQFLEETIRFARGCGIHVIACDTPTRKLDGMTLWGDENTLPFHDREIVLHGAQWLERMFNAHPGECFVTVKEWDRRHCNG